MSKILFNSIILHALKKKLLVASVQPRDFSNVSNWRTEAFHKGLVTITFQLYGITTQVSSLDLVESSR